MLNEYTYDIWGGPLTTDETVPNVLRYAGEYWDETVGLQYLRVRWYDPGMARFIGEDTFEGELNDPLSLNLYSYVSNNPLKYVDPSGHMHTEIGLNYSANDRTAIKKYQYIFKVGQAENNVYIMQAAHDAANLIRLNYQKEVKRTYFVDYMTGKHTKTRGSLSFTADNYYELFNGNAKSVSLLDDPLFYVFDGTFAVAYRSISKVALKAIGKKGVDRTTSQLLKLDLQLFGKSIKKINDRYLKEMGLDAHKIKYEFLGKNAKVAQYDLYVDSVTKEILIFKKVELVEEYRLGTF